MTLNKIFKVLTCQKSYGTCKLLACIQKLNQLQTQPSPLVYGWHIVNELYLPIRHTHPSLLPSITPRTVEWEDQSSNESSEDDSETDSSGSHQSNDTDDMDN